jgi:MFS family permease
MACMVAFGLLSVRLTNKFGVRSTCLTATVLFGVGLISTSFTIESLGGLFCVAGVLVGVSTSLLYTTTNSLPPQWFSGKLGLANGLVKAGGGIGATVLPILGQNLIDKVGLEWTFRIFGFLVLATGLPCSFLLRDFSTTTRNTSFNFSLLKNVPFLTLALGGAIGVFALFVPPFFLPLFANSIGLSSSTGAALVAGFGFSTALGRLFGGWFCDLIGPFNALAITCALNALSMLAIWPVSSSLPPLFIFAIINGIANGSFFTGLPTAVAAIAPGSKAASISLMTSFWTPGYLLGPPLAGMLIEATGAEDASEIGPYRAAIFYAAGVGVLSLGLIIWARMGLERKVVKKL